MTDFGKQNLVDSQLTEDIRIIGKLGEGSHGTVYIGNDTQTGRKVAVKILSSATTDIQSEHKFLQKIKGKGNFPKGVLLESTETMIGSEALVLQYLGPNLHQLFNLCNYDFPIATVKHLMSEMIMRLEELHSCGIIHRDIKPDNFCLGKDLQMIYLIDFGLCEEIFCSNGRHKKYDQNEGFVGTPRYASKSAHLGFSQGRRDDLEALGYLGVYFCNGDLPWKNIPTKNYTKRNQLILNSKLSTSVSTLCSNLPSCFIQYFNYVSKLEFTEEPDYEYLRDLFKMNLEEFDPFEDPYPWECQEKYDLLISKHFSEEVEFKETECKKLINEFEVPEEGVVRRTTNICLKKSMIGKCSNSQASTYL